MSKWVIAKEFNFCYGHRVWSQELLEDYALTTHCKCRHLHGHEGKIIVHLSGDELTNGMVVDFNNLNFVKKYIDDYLDHKFIMDINDPLIPHEVPIIDEVGGVEEALEEVHIDMVHLHRIRPTLLTNLPLHLKEKYEGLVFVNFVPTSENLCEWFYRVVSNKMKKININVESITFYETPKSSCVFSR